MAEFKLSDEQEKVIELLDTHNVLVDSVAGSGKTTTILHVALKYPESPILLITYNKKLKFETRQRVEEMGIKNVEVHSYHSFCVKYYLRTCFTDSGIIKITTTGVKKLKKFNYKYIILDESQDMTPLYYSLICKIYDDNSCDDVKMCILGDKKQSIYAFNKADERFIVFAKLIFNFNKVEWESVKLSTSFRITKPMAQFVNEVMLNENNLNSIKDGGKVRYLICNSFCTKYGGKVYDEVKMYITKGYKHEDIFILAPSVRGAKSPVRTLANFLSTKGIPVHVPNNDEEKLDEDILKNKIAFSTFHQVKGLERKIVIVFGFDETYFQYYKKDADPDLCPNELYVATTRAKEHLTLIHNKNNGFMPFLNLEKLPYIADIQGYIKQIPTETNIGNSARSTEVTVKDVVKFLPCEVIETALKYLVIDQVQKKEKNICIPIKTKQGDLYENVEEITEVAIPGYFEFLKTNNMTIAKSKKFTSISTCELLKISNKWCASKTGYNYKLTQIKEYDWLTVEDLNSCIARLGKYISKNSEYEKNVSYYNCDELIGYRLDGYIDCIDNCVDNNSNNVINVWEFKCNKVEPEHFIQVGLYAYLYLKTTRTASADPQRGTAYTDPQRGAEAVNFYIFNILDNSIFKMEFETDKLIEMVKYLFNYKYGDRKIISDLEFIENANSRKEFNHSLSVSLNK